MSQNTSSMSSTLTELVAWRGMYFGTPPQSTCCAVQIVVQSCMGTAWENCLPNVNHGHSNEVHGHIPGDSSLPLDDRRIFLALVVNRFAEHKHRQHSYDCKPHSGICEVLPWAGTVLGVSGTLFG